MRKLLLTIAIILFVGCKSNEMEIRAVAEQYARANIAPALGGRWSIQINKQQDIGIIKRGSIDQLSLCNELERIWLDYKISIEIPTGEDLRDFLIRESLERSTREALLHINSEDGYYSVSFLVRDGDNNPAYDVDIILSRDLVVQNVPIDVRLVDSIMTDIAQ